MKGYKKFIAGLLLFGAFFIVKVGDNLGRTVFSCSKRTGYEIDKILDNSEGIISSVVTKGKDVLPRLKGVKPDYVLVYNEIYDNCTEHYEWIDSERLFLKENKPSGKTKHFINGKIKGTSAFEAMRYNANDNDRMIREISVKDDKVIFKDYNYYEIERKVKKTTAYLAIDSVEKYKNDSYMLTSNKENLAKYYIEGYKGILDSMKEEYKDDAYFILKPSIISSSEYVCTTNENGMICQHGHFEFLLKAYIWK